MAVTTDTRRIGYYIPQSDGTVDFAVRAEAADSDVLAELNQIVSVIFDVQPIVIAFKVVESNFIEIEQSVDHCRVQLDNLAPVSVVPVSLALEGLALFSQKITNFLSSASAFVAQTQTQLTCANGKDSHLFKVWDEKRKNLHAGRFSYRFLYELRNYAQHRSIPFSSFHISGNRGTNRDLMAFKLQILISRISLLEEGYNWKNKLRVEIEQQHPEFDLLPLLSEYLHSLRHLCLEALQMYDQRLAVCAHYFSVVSRLLKLPHNAVPAIFIGDSPSKSTPPSRHEIIPMAQLTFLMQEYLRLRRDRP